jgi:hypothetical protein
VSVLLRQPHGFEGFFHRPVLPAFNDETISDSAHEHVSIVDADPAVAHTTSDHRRGDYVVALVTYLEQVELDLGKRLYESAQKLLVGITANVRAWVRLVCAGVVNQARVERGQIEVAGRVPGVEEPARVLHVLLRHRPRSIPQAQESA